MYEIASQIFQCPSCKQQIEVEQRWTPGGVNDYGGFVLRCSGCGHVFDHRVGRDVNDSRVKQGATVLESYEDEDRAAVRAKHGLE